MSDQTVEPTTAEIIERLRAIAYNLNDWDHPITAREDIEIACHRLMNLEKKE